MADNKGMKFLQKLRGEKSMGKTALDLGMVTGSYHYLESKARGCDMATLVQIKRHYKVSWNDLGKLIEAEVDGQLKKLD